MQFPRVFAAVTLIAIGAFAPSAFARPTIAAPDEIGMGHEKFDQDTVTVVRGATIKFRNDSGWLHVVGPGDDGRLTNESGAPAMGADGAFLSETNDVFTTGPWNVPGTYHVTCSLHPEMNITVIVTEK